MATRPASENPYPEVLLNEVAAPAAAPSGKVRLYAKSDGLLYAKDDAGAETFLGGDVAAHTGDTTDAHDASAISADTTGYDNSAGDDVQQVLGDFDAAITAAAGGGGGGDVGIGHAIGDYYPASAGTYDEEFEGTADTLPANWSWADNTPTFRLNSRWPSWLYIDRGADTTTTYTLRRASFAPGTGVTWGAWVHLVNGGRAGGYLWNVDFYVLNSDNSEGVGLSLADTHSQQTLGIAASSESRNALGFTMLNPSMYFGITRDASDRWRGYISQDGIGWTCVLGAGSNGLSKTLTPARIEIRFKAAYNDAAPGRQGIDFLRYRTDTDFPRP